jgi:hypothetical protein
MPASHAVRKAMRGLLWAALFASVAWSIAPSSDKSPTISTSRWEEGQPGCTFSRDDDGKYRYGFWTDDFGVILAVDSQELEKVRRRAQPLFSLLLTIRYRGKDSLDVAPDKIVLEFVKHYHDVHSPLNPDSLASEQQRDTDALAEEIEREIRKHPEKTADKEAQLATAQKNSAEMIEFLKTRTLRPTTLDPGHPEATGWVLFGTTGKWIDGLKKQEEFVLRVAIENRIVEFPFSLPPSEGDLILRSRPEK